MKNKCRKRLSQFFAKHFPFWPMSKRAVTLYDILVSRRWHEVHSIHIDFWKERGGCRNHWRNRDLLCFTQLTKSACPYKPCYVMRYHWPPIAITEQWVHCIKPLMTDIVVCRRYQKQSAILRNNDLVLSFCHNLLPDIKNSVEYRMNNLYSVSVIAAGCSSIYNHHLTFSILLSAVTTVSDLGTME